MKGMDNPLTEEELAQIEQPIAAARTLPRRAFYDEGIYEFEVENMLARTWLAIAFSEHVPRAGDVSPMTVLGRPLLLVRNRSGGLNIFHNVVPYDGSEVAIKAATGLEQIVTPYHGLVYDLDGGAIAAPFWNGTPAGASPPDARLHLRRLRCEEWFGTVFVNLSGGAEPFEVYLRPVADYFMGYRLDRLHIGKDEESKAIIHDLKCRANWKTMYENYSPNVYHESFVHDMYRRSPHSPRVDAHGRKTYSEIVDPRGFLGLCYDNRIADGIYGPRSPLPPILLNDGRANPTNTIVNMYPNWVITMLHNQARIAFMLPEGPECCTQFIANFFDESAAAPELAEDRRTSWRAGVKARTEDNLVCESIQRARHSPGVQTQFFNTFWDTPHWVLTRMFARRYREACRPPGGGANP